MSTQSSEAKTDVITSLKMVSIAGHVEEAVEAILTFRAAEPFLVRAKFTLPGANSVDWVLSRDLLREGVALPTGIGDVRLYPGDQGLLLELRSNLGRAFLYGPIEPVVDFVQRMYALVPDGAEDQHYSVDAEMQTLVGAWADPDRHSSGSS
jgi:hypothetical protein